jgi:hypothetical protein
MTSLKTIDDIKKEVKIHYDKIDKKQFIKNCYNSIIHESNLMSVIFPLHYLVDSSLNTNIGNNYKNVNNIRSHLNLDSLFNLTSNNIYDIPHPSHSTKIYKLNYNDKLYIYYSNTGSGAENHIIDTINNTVVPKLYYVTNEKDTESIINFIVNYLDTIKNVDIRFFAKDRETNKEHLELYFYKNIKQPKISQLKVYDIITSYDDFSNICKNIIMNVKDKDMYLQHVIYALLNYIIYKFPTIIQEVSFNFLINGNDDEVFTKNINRLSKNLDDKKIHTLFDFFKYCINTDDSEDSYNTKINKEIYDLGKDDKYKIKTNINDFIILINEELKKIDTPTIKYKLKDFKLQYNGLYGIINSLQISSSCTFYSYYNLAINMLVLNLFNINDVNEFINKFNIFHYYMIYLFALSLDIEYIPDNIFNANSLYNYNYIYEICKKNYIIKEITFFYNKETFIYKNYDSNILNLNLDGLLYKSTDITKFDIENIYHNYSLLNTYFNSILNKIRNGEFKEITDYTPIKKELSEIMDNIEESLMFSGDYYILTRKLRSSGRYIPADTHIYITSITDIYWIYLIILINIYNKSKKFEFNVLAHLYYKQDFYSNDIGKPINQCIEHRSNPNRLMEESYYNYYNLYEKFDLLKKLNRDEILNLYGFIGSFNSVQELINNLNINREINMCKFIAKKVINNWNSDLDSFQYNYIIPPVDINLNTFDFNVYNNTNSPENFYDYFFNKYIERFKLYGKEHEPHDEDHQDMLDFIDLLKFTSHEVYIPYIFFRAYKCYDIIKNTSINNIIKNKYINIKNNIILKFRLYFKESILNDNFNKNPVNLSEFGLKADHKYDYNPFFKLNDINEQFYMISLLLTNFKYCFINENDFYKIYALINKFNSDTKLFIYNSDILTTDNYDIFYPMFENTELFESEYFPNCFINTINKIKWINNLGITFTDDLSEFIYETNKYINLRINNNNNSSNYLSLILSRFGFSINDQNKCLLLFDTAGLDVSTSGYSIKTTYTGKILILCNTYHRCIEICFSNNKIEIDECYIFDVYGKYNIIFDFNLMLYPFLKFLPETSPYLLYKQNNDYYIDILLTDGFNRNNKLKIYNVTFKKNITKIELYHLYKFKIAKSDLFPTVSTFDLDLHNKLIEIYNGDNYSFFKDKNKYIQYIKYNFDDLTEFVSKIKEICLQMVTIDQTNIDLFKNAILTILQTDEPSYNYKLAVDSFLSEYRLCSSSGVDTTNENILKNYENLFDELRSKLEESKIELESKDKVFKEYTKYEYIIINIDKFIKIMIINILLDLQILKIDITCWDIQTNLNILNNIQNFIDKIKTDYFYLYEILFMLQNDYIYSKSQLDKYKDILQDLINDNKELKLHQFMMGKGKTSIFTPLLAFSIKLLKQKEPIIITASHLVRATKQFMLLTEQLLSYENNKLVINVFSDIDAKKRWIENTDISLKDKHNFNLENEYNIIDEFDSHHNYLQSMFNYVIEEKKIINEHIMTYIYLYTAQKLNFNDDIVIDKTKKIENVLNNDIFNRHIDNTYDTTTNMIYNKDYGIEALTLSNFNINILCTPFSRKDTPVVGSNFSNLLLRLILTFKTYLKNFNGELTDFDFKYMERNNKIIFELINMEEFLLSINNQYINDNLRIDTNLKKIKLLVNELYELYYLNLDIKTENFIKNKLKDIFKIIYDDCTPFIKLMIVFVYLYKININYLKNTTKQLNLSFQDIIYNTYNQWQVGYTGTAYLKLNKYEDYNLHNNIFRQIIIDPDEKIEILLALQNYGSPKKDISVVTINNISDINIAIDIILTRISNKPRGIVDLAGLFLDYDNMFIAKLFKNKLDSKRIIYFNNLHKPLEYTDSNSINYRGIDNDNFYYYDQSHTIGTDVKQPQFGHFAIIINKNTRMTDFAQAIFRFRKLNRGTYLSVIFISDIDVSLDNNDIYSLLKTNENIFQENQQMGIKYQLLKAIARNETRNYQEDYLEPLYLREREIDRDELIKYMNKNIKYIETTKNTTIKQIKEELFGNYDKLKQVIFDNNGDSQIQINTQTETQTETQTQTQTQTQVQQELQTLTNNKTYLNMFKSENYYVVEHLNCIKCKFESGYRLFNKDFNQKLYPEDPTKHKDMYKDIFISYNLLKYPDTLYALDITNQEKTSLDRLSYVEFDTYILIEIEYICLKYYIDKLPVYDFNGNLLNITMYNKLYEIDTVSNDQYILNINKIFYIAIGIPIKYKVKNADIIEAIDNLTPIGLIILKYHYLICKTNRYTIHDYLYKKLKTLDETYKISVLENNDSSNTYKLDHDNEDVKLYLSNGHQQEDQYKIIKGNFYYNRQNDLQLSNKIIKYNFNIFQYNLDKLINYPKKDKILTITKFITSISTIGGCINKNSNKYKYKYLKYKQKYINLKLKLEKI